MEKKADYANSTVNSPSKKKKLQLKITYYLCIKGKKLLFSKCMRVNTLQKQENTLQKRENSLEHL